MLEIIYLEGCYFSESALQLIKQYKLKYKIIFVKKIEKEMIKRKFNIKSFPQIYLLRTIRRKSVKELIGGCDKFKSYINTINYIKNDQINIDILNSLSKLIK